MKLQEILQRYQKKYDLFVKEHNCDYLTSFQIKERREAGINAINVAPELGYLQTKTTIYLADKFNIKRLLFNYKDLVLKSKKVAKMDLFKKD